MYPLVAAALCVDEITQDEKREKTCVRVVPRETCGFHWSQTLQSKHVIAVMPVLQS